MNLRKKKISRLVTLKTGRQTAAVLIVLSAFTGTLCGIFSSSTGLGKEAVLTFEQQTSTAKTKDIAIRNLTQEAVPFTFKFSHSSRHSQREILETGALQRFTEGIPLFVTFRRQDKEITYRLSPGVAYTFRYNENDKLELYKGSHGRTDAVDLAPYVSTPMRVVEKMLQMAQITKKDMVYDLGCGDGRIVIAAAKKYGAKGVGIDLDPQRIRESRAYARVAGVSDLLEFRVQDVMEADISSATVVTLYLLPESNALIRPLLEEKLQPGTRVVSHNYHIPGWELKEIGYAELTTGDMELHTIFVYRIK